MLQKIQSPALTACCAV